MSHLDVISALNTSTFTEISHSKNWKATKKPPQVKILRVSRRWGVRGKEESGT